MASRPDIEVTRESTNRGEIIAYVPQIGKLTSRGGLHYDLAVSEEVSHTNEFTRHPIEDPTHSFIYDHNREEPTAINLELIVSSNPLVAGGKSAIRQGIDRLTLFQDAIMALRAAQSVDTSAYLDVYTGLRVYHKMGIESLTFRREPEEPNVLYVSITLVEFRFANPPYVEGEPHPFEASHGPRSTALTSEDLVTEPDRYIVESTRSNITPRIANPSQSQIAGIKKAIDKLDPVSRAKLNIVPSTKAVAARVGLMLLNDTPSQRFTVTLDNVQHDIQFDYNATAGRWSFTAGITGADCPKIAGRIITPGVNLYAGITASQLLVPIDRPGISVTGQGWYQRLTQPMNDGAGATLLVTGSLEAFGGIFRPRTSIAC